MGKLYQQVGRHLSGTFSGEVIVEIGSDRWEGSSAYFADLANTHSMQFITVDLDPGAGIRLRKTVAPEHVPLVEFVLAEGTAWSKQYSGPAIKALYLDNFDYIWDINNVSPAIQVQMQDYAGQGIAMNNQNCQAEHMRQIVALRTCLAPGAVVIFDDTYCYNDCWIGKCGPAVVYLQAYGWSVVHQTLDCGVIMKRLDKVS
jgi:hypothetical protein